MKILLADDDEDQLEVRCLLLEHHGFTCIPATNGEGALHLAIEHQPNVAVIDLRLPREQDGLDLITRMKASFPAMYVILLTGADPARLQTRPQIELVDELVAKGVGSGKLVSAINKAAARFAA